MQISLETIREESQLNIEELAKIINGHRFTGIICAAARLGLADLLDGKGATPFELADSVKCRPDMLHRLLRALAAIGIFEETALGTFRHTRASLLLRQNAEPSLQGLASMTSLMHFHTWPEILHSLRTGEAAFNKVFGAGLYDYMADHPEAAEPFDRAMGAYTEIVTAAVLENYDFAPYSHIDVVGGGAGIWRKFERYGHIHGTVSIVIMWSRGRQNGFTKWRWTDEWKYKPEVFLSMCPPERISIRSKLCCVIGKTAM
jgi:hypothetical protein